MNNLLTLAENALSNVIPPDKEKIIKTINWILTHDCNVKCDYCKITKRKTAIMSPEQRKLAFQKLKTITTAKPIIGIGGGEPTLFPEYLSDSVKELSEIGFMSLLITNGINVKEDLIKRLIDNGLSYLAVSVDIGNAASPKNNLDSALRLLKLALKKGVIPVVNAVITSSTDPEKFKEQASKIIYEGCGLNTLMGSPVVDDGQYSSMAADFLPNESILKDLIIWLITEKIFTGKVINTIPYLKVLYNLKKNGETHLWHCPEIRRWLTLNSDGTIGPCQEFPDVVNLLEMPKEQLSLRALHESFARKTQKCPGCLYECYIKTDEVNGLKHILEIPGPRR